DRGDAELRAGGEVDPRAPRPGADRRDDHRAPQAGRQLRHDAAAGRGPGRARRPHRRRDAGRGARARGALRSRRGDARMSVAVEREYYWNDAGKQMERVRESVAAVRRGEEPPEDGYHGDYVAQLAEVDGDPVPAMLEQILATLGRFRVDFSSNIKEVELVPEI